KRRTGIGVEAMRAAFLNNIPNRTSLAHRGETIFMQKSTKAIRAAAPLLAILGMVAPFILPMTHISSAQAQEEYLPTQKDFVGKWQLSGATTR
ncbi:hypothetical protein EN819_34850, partial [Mesorhizobium sp. M1C.F.Ca.ET.176.01.1.1]